MSDGEKVAGWDYEAEMEKLLGPAYPDMPLSYVGYERANALHLIAVSGNVGRMEEST